MKHYFVLQTNLLLAANIIINLIHYIYVYTHYYCQLSINEICHCKNCYFYLTTTRSATSVSSVLVVISGEIYQLLFWRLPHRNTTLAWLFVFFPNQVICCQWARQQIAVNCWKVSEMRASIQRSEDRLELVCAFIDLSVSLREKALVKVFPILFVECWWWRRPLLLLFTSASRIMPRSL